MSIKRSFCAALIVANKRNHFAEQHKLVNDNRFVIVVFRLKAKMSFFFVVSFNGCFVAYKRHNNVAVVCNGVFCTMIMSPLSIWAFIMESPLT